MVGSPSLLAVTMDPVLSVTANGFGSYGVDGLSGLGLTCENNITNLKRGILGVRTLVRILFHGALCSGILSADELVTACVY